SPVAMCTSAKSSRNRSACVPLPAPGGPSMIRFSSDKSASLPASAGSRLLQEALVTSHHQLRLELLHRFQRDADHDQDRGPSKRDVLVGASDQDRRQRGDGGEEQGARERQPREDPVEEFGRRAPRPDAGDEAAVLL